MSLVSSTNVCHWSVIKKLALYVEMLIMAPVPLSHQADVFHL